MTKESLIKAREARKPKSIYECDNYIIEEIPLNYRATIKCKRKNNKCGREHYSHPEHGLDYIKELVESAIDLSFKSGKYDPDYLNDLEGA